MENSEKSRNDKVIFIKMTLEIATYFNKRENKVKNQHKVVKDIFSGKIWHWHRIYKEKLWASKKYYKHQIKNFVEVWNKEWKI